VPSPCLDDDLGFLERVDDLAVEQLVPELTSVMPIERIASAVAERGLANIQRWRGR
jgi:hypothetical protein